MLVDKAVSDFIENNSDNGVVIQIKKANKENNREAFFFLLEEIKRAIWLDHEIKRDKRRIQSHIASIKDIKREIGIKKNLLKNSRNFHKINKKRGNG